MSMVIGTVSKNFAIISGDTRATNDSDIVSDDFQKVFKVNDSVLLGITGGALVVSELVKRGYHSTNLGPAEYLEFLFELIGGNQITNESQYSNIVVLGKANPGEGFGGNFNTSEMMIQNNLTVTNSLHAWTPILTPPNIDHQSCVQNFRYNLNPILKDTSKTDLEKTNLIKNLQVELIKAVSQIDESVNDNIQTHITIF